MEALAGAGYLVVAPNHQDARTGWYPGKFLLGPLFNRPEESFRKQEEWTDATYRNREADIKAVLDEILAAKIFQGTPLDASRVGIVGHSLGGYTALGLAGAWPTWKDTRIKAVLALSPYCSPYILKGDLPHLGVPVMYQGGTRDVGITPTVRRPGGAYDLSAAPKYFVELDGAGHLAWTDISHEHQDLIVRYGVAFFDRYLKGITDPDPLAPLTATPPRQGVADLEVQLK
jgi:predicted dienelactone hydrolase